MANFFEKPCQAKKKILDVMELRLDGVIEKMDFLQKVRFILYLLKICLVWWLAEPDALHVEILEAAVLQHCVILYME